MAETQTTPSPTGNAPPPGSAVAPQPQEGPDDLPLVYVTRRPWYQLLDLRELARHRDLLWILAVRDLKVRYRQTVVGLAWTILQPLGMLAAFLLLFGLLGRRPGGDESPYALVLLCGLLPWQLVASILTRASSCLVENQHLVGKVYFPRVVLPLATTAPPLVDFAVGISLLLALALGLGASLSWRLVLVPAFLGSGLLASLGAGLWLAALNALYRDVGHLVPFLLQFGFFISPVCYPATLVPARWALLYGLNPLVGPIEGLRWCLLGQGDIPWQWLATSVLTGGALLISGLAYFRRVERFLADRI